MARALGIAAELDLAETLAPGPLPSAELARAAGADADALEWIINYPDLSIFSGSAL